MLRGSLRAGTRAVQHATPLEVTRRSDAERVLNEIGVFARIAGNDDDAARGNPVETEFSFGGQMLHGDHVIGIAIALVSLNTNLAVVPAEDLEITLEVYYLVNLEGGKLQITPFFMYVQDPVGGGAVNDSLFILGVRVHVPF